MKPTGDSLRRISDERLVKWESELKDDMDMGTPATKAEAGRIYDLIADLRDARAALRSITTRICLHCNSREQARAYFDAKARETKREGAE